LARWFQRGGWRAPTLRRSRPGSDSFRDQCWVRVFHFEFCSFFADSFLMTSVTSRAPPTILNVLPGQPVEVRVARRTEEDYVSSPLRGFAGSGSRLGGVVPEAESASVSSAPAVGMPGGFPRLGSASTSISISGAPPPTPRTRDPDSVAPRFSVDQTKPTTSVQVRLADGTRFERFPWACDCWY
jgi:hypothetical protein